MPKVTQEYRDARRDQILSAARQCFLRDGFHATSMQDLFAEAGLSSGAVYRYFASKDDVIVAIAEENIRDVLAMIQKAAAEQPGRPVGAVVAEVMEVVRAKHERDGLASLALLVWSESLRNPPLAAQLRNLLNGMHADLAEVVRQHQGREAMPREVSAEALARILISNLVGYILQLVTLGPGAVREVPAAVRALWP